ncbi:glutamine synthetase type III N terminal-domain-containing protein [Syncephalis pseudoplumigaleata]|uniref:Glutamine synthetase type III N terminal-domain-containing protein n=1 Tax=Syncephalis pseudoplumigaleata TaxID=1712513 RepID=A0A4P9Z5S0_9FUNG|nr:glutamine synthetase type III N terminal-domain-containing protein [Syncephalis pseudoplumigaleata]|eukprot:RKP27977.1 glutamine synthetase type III N terminal-domain-containing protein [Syncephalis pseudoplumigaleata]
MSEQRKSAIIASPYYPSELYGRNVFTLKDMANALPKSVFASFLRQMRGRQTLDKATSDAVAHAVRIWAMDRGATHFSHWFQPQTDTTAEKHDAFLALKNTSFLGEGVHAIDTFHGSELLQSEPDASSFPSGGMRTTFEARGYTIWDTTSPMFIQPHANGTAVLYIPSVFISYNGDALDEKTVLLRSSEAVSRTACTLLNLLDPAPPGHPCIVNQVFTTLGTEQEFFLVDRALYALRPDLKICGRSLIGNLPPRHQQLEDHYFGKLPSRVLSAISEVELELYKLGVPLKTRHNEVAPAQFEVAPIFEEAVLAVDHNLLTMDAIHKVAHRHKLKALFHEKPFAGINGSGKHCNWSLSTDRGENLLDPTEKPETNYRFLLFLVAVLHAVHKHGGLLRAGISSASNDHRLGANEAPPGIISVFLGEHLTEVLRSIEESRPIKNFSRPEIQTIKLGGRVLDVKVSTLPNIARDLTDRNRTSPFAFTGNKFEFRAVGSKQSPSFPVTLLNTAIASSLSDVAAALREQMGDRPYPTDADKLAVIKKFIVSSKPVCFEGDNYSDSWVVEAEKRGLLNIRNAPDAFEQLQDATNRDMLLQQKVFNDSELQSRYHILHERYAKDVLIEVGTLLSMINTMVLPAAFEYRKSLAETCASLVAIGSKDMPERTILDELAPAITALQRDVTKLEEVSKEVEAIEEASVKSHAACERLLPLMDAIRANADFLEHRVPDKTWAIPKYTELLFTSS